MSELGVNARTRDRCGKAKRAGSVQIIAWRWDHSAWDTRASAFSLATYGHMAVLKYRFDLLYLWLMSINEHSHIIVA
jgi:hypothetical protein